MYSDQIQHQKNFIISRNQNTEIAKILKWQKNSAKNRKPTRRSKKRRRKRKEITQRHHFGGAINLISTLDVIFVVVAAVTAVVSVFLAIY